MNNSNLTTYENVVCGGCVFFATIPRNDEIIHYWWIIYTSNCQWALGYAGKINVAMWSMQRSSVRTVVLPGGVSECQANPGLGTTMHAAKTKPTSKTLVLFASDKERKYEQHIIKALVTL